LLPASNTPANLGFFSNLDHTTFVIGATVLSPNERPSRSSAATSALLLRANLERLVAGGRVVIASILLVAAVLDGSFDPAALPRLFGLGLYLALALVQLGLVMRALRPLPGLVRIEVGADAGLIALLLLLPGQSTWSVAVLVFVIVAAGLRRPPRVVLLTGTICLALFIATAIGFSRGSSTAGDLDRVVLRTLLLVLSTAALTVLSVERDRLLLSLAGRTQWPPRDWPDLHSALFDLLGTAADLAKGARVALVWADREEPWTNVAVLDDELTLSHVAPDGGVVQHIDPDESFVCDRLGDGESVVTRVTATGLVKWRGAPLSRELLTALAPTPRSIIGVRAQGRTFSGHLLILGLERIPSDLVLHAELLARQIAGSLDMWLLARRTRELAAREERGRVWRDLHDGVLQSLTGLALMLARAEKAIEADQADARRILDEAAALVHDEQRDLRFSILEQKAAASSTGLPEDLPTLIAELARRFERVWGLRVETHVDPTVVLGPSSSLQIARMIQEALSNSARHGHSTRARLAVTGAGDALHVSIEDNGKGFPFVGTFDHATLIERRIGPVLLKDRVQRLQGTLGIRSAPTGVELDIRIPLHSAILS